MNHQPLPENMSVIWNEAKKITDHMESVEWQTLNISVASTLRHLISVTGDNTAIQNLLHLARRDSAIVQHWINRLLFFLNEQTESQYANAHDASVFLYEFLLINFFGAFQDYQAVQAIAQDVERKGINLFWGAIYPHAVIHGQL